MTAASGPSVMMTTASAPPVVVTAPDPAHVSVAVTVAALDLDQGAVHRGRGRHAQPGGSGYGHGQRSKQRSSDQNETSHLVSLPSRHRDQAQVPDERVCSPKLKTKLFLRFRVSITGYSRPCAAVAHHATGSTIRSPARGARRGRRGHVADHVLSGGLRRH